MQDDAPHLIGRATSGGDPSDPTYWTAALYRLADGETFLVAGSGGPESAFAPTPEDPKGRAIEMTESEAYNWAASHLSIDTVEEYFDHLSEEI